jgi:hypothetical protein
LTRILIRSGKDPLSPVPAPMSLTQNILGTNSGNLLFSDAVHRALSVEGTEVVSSGYLTERGGITRDYVRRMNDEFDAFVVPLANAFRQSFLPYLDRMTGVIEQLDMPVTVVGIGTQMAADETKFAFSDGMKASVKRFMNAVLDRSATVGVRGEMTADFLRRLGYGDEHVEIIGCPSLYMYGADLKVTKKTETISLSSPLAINITPSVQLMGTIATAHARKYDDLIFVAQENARLKLLLWGENPQSPVPDDMPIHSQHRLYREDKIRLFLDPTTWVRFMRERDFSFGTRIHGNIAGLLAGTPSVVLAFDSRTLELAKYHKIPYRMVRDVDAGLDAATLYEEADFTEFNAAHAENFERYRDFLNRNHLANIYTPPSVPSNFASDLEAADLPPAVRSLMAPEPQFREQLIERLSWLHQGSWGDAQRVGQRYQVPFPLTESASNPPSIVKTRNEVVKLQKLADSTNASNKALTAQVESLQRELTAQDQRLKAQIGNLERTLVKQQAMSPRVPGLRPVLQNSKAKLATRYPVLRKIRRKVRDLIK